MEHKGLKTGFARIWALIKLSFNEVYRESNIGSATLSAMSKGRNATLDSLQKFIDYANKKLNKNFTLADLLDIKNPAIESYPIVISRSPDTGTPHNFIPVPLYSDPAALGAGLAISDYEIEEDWCVIHSKWLRHSKKPDRYRAIRVAGDSMAPLITGGDILCIDTEQTDPARLQNQIVAASIGGEEITIKRLHYYRQTGILYLEALNRDYETEAGPLQADMKKVKIYGKVVWAWKKLE